MLLSWYFNRLRTFSVREFFFRIRQRLRNSILDKRHSKKETAKTRVLPESMWIQNEKAHFEYPIFESSIDIFKPIDWHLDVSSGRIFPKIFSHSIAIRSEKYGSAKHVWEVNRLLFLTYVARQYKETIDENYLSLFMYHLTSWKNENPYLCGVNWYSNIEINLRLINWHYCWVLLDAENLVKKNRVFQEFVQSVWEPLIFEHTEYSFQHPSFYSSANNHLISEYTGLFVAACTWEIPAKKRRFAYAQKGLEREILKQNSEDGVNKEEAAEYIQFINDFFLIAAIVGKTSCHPFSVAYETRLRQMARYLNQMSDQNGNYPMYGDGDDGFCLRPDAGGHFNNFTSQLSAFATYFQDATLKRSDAHWDEKCELMFGVSGRHTFEMLSAKGDPQSSYFCKDSGHFIFRKKEQGREIYLHFNAAPLGYLSIAAHGHADALSFLLHLDGHPVFVDSGTYTYHTQPEWRKYFVGTLAHNTIRINGQDQAQLAGPTLWLKHYRCRLLKSSLSPEKIVASHDGYLKFGITHIREIEFNRSKNEFVITDTLNGNGSYIAEIPFHIHPKITVTSYESGFMLSAPQMRNIILTPDAKLSYQIIRGQTSPLLGWYSEHFGEKEPASTLYATQEFCDSTVFISKIQVIDD